MNMICDFKIIFTTLTSNSYLLFVVDWTALSKHWKCMEGFCLIDINNPLKLPELPFLQMFLYHGCKNYSKAKGCRYYGCRWTDSQINSFVQVLQFCNYFAANGIILYLTQQHRFGFSNFKIKLKRCTMFSHTLWNDLLQLISCFVFIKSSGY